MGFLPTAQHLFEIVTRSWALDPSVTLHEVALRSAPMWLALLFFFSIPRPKSFKGPSFNPWLTLPIPMLISFLFGFFHPGPGWMLSQDWATISWYLIFIPILEESLFRGWLFSFIERLWPNLMASATNPFPVSVWGASLAFAIWHLQNAGLVSPPLVAFQFIYTFFVGMWLGAIRMRTQGIGLGIVFHSILNASCGF